MNDKERLQTIKDQFEWGEENLESGIYNIESEDVQWLISQAEKNKYWRIQHRKRADELEDAYFKIQLLENELQQAKAKAERYEKALENIVISIFPLDIDDAVAIANQALLEVKKNERRV